MENASKALIIAGAILLSILLISLGIMVYNNAKNTIGNANLDKQEIESFNAEWASYEGTAVSASKVQAMVQAVNASNATEAKKGANAKYITITTGGAAKTSAVTAQPSAFATSGIAQNKTYAVKLGYDQKTGCVVGIDYK